MANGTNDGCAISLAGIRKYMCCFNGLWLCTGINNSTTLLCDYHMTIDKTKTIVVLQEILSDYSDYSSIFTTVKRS